MNSTFPDATPEDLHDQGTAIVEEPADTDDDFPEDASEADVADQRAEVTFDEEDAPIG